jgi:hypothetical protein
MTFEGGIVSTEPMPTLHDIARGTTGAGDDDYDIATANWVGRPWPTVADDDHWEYAGDADGSDLFTIEVPDVALNLDTWSDYLNRHHVHDAGCNGTLEHSEEILCGYPGSTGHIYCG